VRKKSKHEIHINQSSLGIKRWVNYLTGQNDTCEWISNYINILMVAQWSHILRIYIYMKKLESKSCWKLVRKESGFHC